MTSLCENYKQLLASPTQLLACIQVASVTDFFSLLKTLWQLELMSDAQLLVELQQCNRQFSITDVQLLQGVWLPYRYYPKAREIAWCFPAGRALEPFMDEYIQRCRQQIICNQFLSPRVSLDQLLRVSRNAYIAQPAGFIFHLSRCGSTLVSGAFAEVESCSVLSESSLLTEILLDAQLSLEEKRQLLPMLIHLQGLALSTAKHIVIKWNAWDLYWWPLIRQLYPQVPVLLLLRGPLEILASHQRLSGRHMSGDPSLTSLDPVFTQMSGDENILDFRISILSYLLEAMDKISNDPNTIMVDYVQLNPEKIYQIIEHFGIALTADECAHIQKRMKFHSKAPQHVFQSDSLQKQQLFTAAEQEKIHCALMPLYKQLLTHTLEDSTRVSDSDT